MTARPQRSVVRSAYSAMARMRPRTVVSLPIVMPGGCSATTRATSARCRTGTARSAAGISKRKALRAGDSDPGAAPPEERGAAAQEPPPGAGAPQPAEEIDRLAVVLVSIVSQPFPEVTLPLEDPEPLGEDGLALLASRGD